ncbi:CPBP family intramembrane glutamic endopeptidase [Haloarchaeobius sp. HRN-SO-5]|uniref:CPBP family intramembrane glutamic endopeptidase n=1 Tax=Haloarchaeobius sp. HRN-SO-5 TaxID=3446118 RepID=UPI003EB90F6D
MPTPATPPVGSPLSPVLLAPGAAGSASFDATAFAGVLVVVTGLLLLLSHATTQSVQPPPAAERTAGLWEDEGSDAHEGSQRGSPATPGADGSETEPVDQSSDPLESMSPGLLLANVAVTQGGFLVVLVGAAVLSDVPASALGLSPGAFGPTALLAGAVLGLGLYVANELGAAVADGAGVEYDERLRTVLAPDDARGWVVLLLLVLPLVAVFEEFLFRAAFVGVLAAGFGLSPWLLAVVSSVLFAVGHGIQGPAGVVVTGGLGLVLATAFVLTGSLVTVVLAHYLVNVLEFVVHEGFGVDWA